MIIFLDSLRTLGFIYILGYKRQPPLRQLSFFILSMPVPEHLYRRKVGFIELVYAQGEEQHTDQNDEQQPHQGGDGESADIVRHAHFHQLRCGKVLHLHGDEAEDGRDIRERVDIDDGGQETRQHGGGDVGARQERERHHHDRDEHLERGRTLGQGRQVQPQGGEGEPCYDHDPDHLKQVDNIHIQPHHKANNDNDGSLHQGDDGG